MMPEKAYWTIEELSEYTGLAVGTLYNWVNQRKIPYTKLKGTVRFHIDRTKTWFDQREVQSKRT